MLNSISENIKKINYEINEAKIKFNRENDDIKLMAVTKTVSPDKINFAVKQGINLLGENRVQEYLEKKDKYDPSAEVHFIGHLQSNKVKYIIENVTLIHSVDSLKLASEINRLAGIHGINMDILAEVNIGREESKSGFIPEAVKEFVLQTSEMKNIRLRGLMTIPPPFDSEYYFDEVYQLYNEIKSENADNKSINILSMGMSSDYIEAIKHGSNIIRIGSGIFGARK